MPCESGIDRDGDQYGDGCAAGLDCDDGAPLAHDSCDPCADPTATGCACNPGEAVSCFDGTAMEAATPPCNKGVRTCDPATSTWGPCAGETKPAAETCDNVDNDCDGTIDEGVQTSCGGCVVECDQLTVGEDAPFPLPGDPPEPAIAVTNDGVGLNPNGDLVLDLKNLAYHYIWSSNHGEGTLSKVDTWTGKEVARYASITHAKMVDPLSLGKDTVAGPTGGCPSRTAVDFFGNVWVANRCGGPSATKIMNDVEDCEDRNGNGMIDTSHDANGDGRITTGDPSEFLGGDDECIAFTVVIGARGDIGRAMTIDAGTGHGHPGNAWIGIYGEPAFYQLDGRTGDLLRRVPPIGMGGFPVNPYGAAVDSKGKLWTTTPNGSTLAWIDTKTGDFGGPFPPVGVCGGSYGMTIDLKDRIWLAGNGCPNHRYDPADGTWAQGSMGAGGGIGTDVLGNVWSSGGSGVIRVNADTLAESTFASGGGLGTGVDFDGNVWSVNGNGTVNRLYIDPTTHEPAPHPLTGNQADSFPVGSGPYTYSDFTGLGLRAVTRGSGDYAALLEACPDGQKAHWLKINVDAMTPGESTVEVFARAGDVAADVHAQMEYGPWAPPSADLQILPGPVPDSRYLELTLRLLSEDRENSPIVKSYSIQWSCPTIVD